jgi:post-segregation antitoxin (ccd killing protein)
MRMARVNVYIPDELADQAKGAGLNVSALTQSAISLALAAKSTDAWLDSLAASASSGVTHADALAALDAERDEAPTRHG